jgi:hypothetical protein
MAALPFREGERFLEIGQETASGISRDLHRPTIPEILVKRIVMRSRDGSASAGRSIDCALIFYVSAEVVECQPKAWE